MTVDLCVEPQVFRRDGAEDFLDIGLPASEYEQGGAAKVEEPGLQGLIAEIAGRPAFGDQRAELAGDPQHFEDPGASGVSGLKAIEATAGTMKRAALAGLEPVVDFIKRRGRVIKLEGHLASGAQRPD
jgi:hypothetical protein